jgi:ML domain
MFRFLLFVAILPAIFARTPVRQCAGGLPLPDAAHMGSRESPCLAEPCSVYRSIGSAVTYVDFTPTVDTVAIRPRVRATVFGGAVTITQELPIEIQRNPCGILESPHTCPLAANQRASYRLELPVDPTTPLIPSDTEITLFGDNNEVIFCYRLNTQVVA